MIQKETASKLRKKGRFYFSLSSHSIDLIEDATALAIFVHLQKQSENYYIRPKAIQNRFNIGRDKYQKSMRHLREKRLIRVVALRDKNNKFCGKELECYSEPYDENLSSEDDFNGSAENPTFHENACQPIQNKTSNGNTENTTVVKSSYIINDQNINKGLSNTNKVQQVIPLPENVDKEKWELYLITRKNKKADISEKSQTNCLKQLLSYKKNNNIEPNDVLDYANDTGWQGLRHSKNAIIKDRISEENQKQRQRQQENKQYSSTDDYWRQSAELKKRMYGSKTPESEEPKDITGESEIVE